MHQRLCICLFNYLHRSVEEVLLLSPMLQMKKQRHRESHQLSYVNDEVGIWAQLYPWRPKASELPGGTFAHQADRFTGLFPSVGWIGETQTGHWLIGGPWSKPNWWLDPLLRLSSMETEGILTWPVSATHRFEFPRIPRTSRHWWERDVVRTLEKLIT